MGMEDYYKYQDNFEKYFPRGNRSDCTKYGGNLYAYAMRQYLMEEFKVKVSYNNAFIKGNPIEYDLLIVKKQNESNLYDKNDVICAIELKAGGTAGDPPDYSKVKANHPIAKNIIDNLEVLYISIYDTMKNQEKLKGTYKEENMFIWCDPTSKEYLKYTNNRTSYIGYLDGHSEKDASNYINGRHEEFKKWFKGRINSF